VLKTIGSSFDAREIDQLTRKGHQWISRHLGQKELDFHDEGQQFSTFISGIQQVRVIGTELLLGRLFDHIGFDRIPDDLFRKLVVGRLCWPASKLKTADYLRKYHRMDSDEDAIYRYMDKLWSTQKETVQQISYEHTLGVLGKPIQVVFYDVTTLYFEIDREDALRKTGFNKAGKHQQPQIVLGLLVSEQGYPLAYEIFEGNTFEGHTFLPVLNAFKRRYNLEELLVVGGCWLVVQIQHEGVARQRLRIHFRSSD
jgi:hypothetical protein